MKNISIRKKYEKNRWGNLTVAAANTRYKLAAIAAAEEVNNDYAYEFG